MQTDPSDQGLHCLPYICNFWKHCSMIKPHCSNFSIITTIFSVSNFLRFLWYWSRITSASHADSSNVSACCFSVRKNIRIHYTPKVWIPCVSVHACRGEKVGWNLCGSSDIGSAIISPISYSSRILAGWFQGLKYRKYCQGTYGTFIIWYEAHHKKTCLQGFAT